jgi:hypothetical protein
MRELALFRKQKSGKNARTLGNKKKEEVLFQLQLRACRCVSIAAMDLVRSNSAFIIVHVLEASYGVPFVNIL